MKNYAGRRTIDGLVVSVDGKPLATHDEVKSFTKYGFEWAYEGASPQQLALAILVDHLGDPDKALRLSEPFMQQVVANLDNDWQLTGADIDAALRALGGLRRGWQARREVRELESREASRGGRP